MRDSGVRTGVQASVPYTLCGTLSFASPVTYTAATRPRSSTAGYLNGDANLDLVVTDYSANSVSVFLGNANGTFQTAVNYPVLGSNPVTPVLGDLNGDTKQDIVVTNYMSSNVSVLLGNGGGTFQGATTFFSNIAPYGLTVGDFNEDTKLDVVVTNVDFGRISVLLGNGNGTLQSPVQSMVNNRDHIVVAGYFNADSHLDLAVTNYTNPTASAVHVLLGNGNGTFQAAVAYPMYQYPDYVTVADVNGDSKTDLVLSHYEPTDNVGVALGNGDGTFQPEVAYTADGDNPTFVAVGDFNGDTIPDLVSPGYSDDNVSVLLGNGNGTFQSAVSFALGSGSSPVAVVPGDFNHDGRLDMVTANENTNDISVLLSNCGAGSVTPSATVAATTTATPTAVATQTIHPTATALTCAAWAVVPSGNVDTFDNYLYGVSAVNAGDIWAVGNYFNADGYSQTLIEHWNGTAWTVVASPNPGTANNWLFGVAAVSANDVWAVGWQANTNIQQPLIVHWDGTAWSEYTVSVARPRVVLQAVSAVAANDVWAVGLSCETAMCNRRVTAVLHYDGTGWSVVSSQDPGAFDNSLDAVSAVSANDVWAVGEACSDNGCSASQSLIEHWNGTAWSVVASPSPGSARTPLLGVDAIPGEAWAVGEACSDGGCVSADSVTLHWNGSVWSVVPSPNPGTVDTHLNAVSIFASSDVWAVGSETSDGSTFGNVVMRWDGASWSVVSVSDPGSVDNDLRGIVGLAAANVWAVGDFDDGDGERTQVQYYSAGPCPSPTPTQMVGSVTPTVAASATPSRTVTVGATASSIASVTPLPTSTICPIQFADVPPGSTFYEFIRCLACRGIINGYPGGIFHPSYQVTRGQLSKIVSNSAGFVDPQSVQMFEDVPVGSTFFDFIGRLASRGYISGYPCGGAGEPCVPPVNLPYFRPNAPATRGQISKIVSNAAGFNEPVSGQTFEDIPPGSTFYEFIERLVSRGVMNGYPCGGAGEPCVPPENRPYFRPNNNATRGQTSKIVANTFFPGCVTPARR
jgi:hypothetical protein